MSCTAMDDANCLNAGVVIGTVLGTASLLLATAQFIKDEGATVASSPSPAPTSAPSPIARSPPPTPSLQSTCPLLSPQTYPQPTHKIAHLPTLFLSYHRPPQTSPTFFFHRCLCRPPREPSRPSRYSGPTARRRAAVWSADSLPLAPSLSPRQGRGGTPANLRRRNWQHPKREASDHQVWNQFPLFQPSPVPSPTSHPPSAYDLPNFYATPPQTVIRSDGSYEDPYFSPHVNRFFTNDPHSMVEAQRGFRERLFPSSPLLSSL